MPLFSRKKKNHSPSNSRPVYPWSAHAPLGKSKSPFPRYCHTLSTTATSTGELFLFGGRRHGSNCNDLYMFSTRDFSTSLLRTSGETPSPRYAHGAALTSTLLLVWGGFTNFSGKHLELQCRVHDSSLYFLNLGKSDLLMSSALQLIRTSCVPVSRKWTSVVVNGPGPGGRYFHTVTLVGSNLFVFGGRIYGGHLNDIWAFNLNHCTSAHHFHEPI